MIRAPAENCLTSARAGTARNMAAKTVIDRILRCMDMAHLPYLYYSGPSPGRHHPFFIRGYFFSGGTSQQYCSSGGISP